MPRDLHEQIIDLIKSNDWTGIARAFQESSVAWHAEEWKQFVENIRTEAAREVMDGIVQALEVLPSKNYCGDPRIKGDIIRAVRAARVLAENPGEGEKTKT